MPEDKMSEDKMPGNLTLTLALILAHTLTGHYPFQFLSTHTLFLDHSTYKNPVSLRTLAISLSFYSHTHTLSLYTYSLFLSTHRHPHSMPLHKHALYISPSLSAHTLSLSLCR